MAPFYAVPKAIKSWAKTSEQDAHASWSDLFFDLLYVGVAFSVGHLLEHSGLTGTGIVLCFAVFWILTQMWLDKVIFFARFDVQDTVHKLIDILEYIIVGLAAVHIGGLPHGSHHHSDHDHDHMGPAERNTAGLAVAACAHTALLIGRYAELALMSKDPATIQVSNKSIYKKGLVLVMRLAAFAHLFGFGPLGTCQKGLSLTAKVLAVLIMTNYLELAELLHVILFKSAGASSSSTASKQETSTASKTASDDKHSGEIGVPLHIGFVAHRFGEFMMLMIGEGVLSLVTASNESPTFHRYVALVMGFSITSAIMYLQYASSVFDVTRHAMRRSSLGGIAWVQVSTLHAFTLVAVGVALRLLLGHVSTLPPPATINVFSAMLGLQLLCAQAVKRLHAGTLGSAKAAFLEFAIGGGLIVALPILAGQGLLVHTGRDCLIYGAAVALYQCLIEVADPLSVGLGERFHDHHDHSKKE